MSLRTCKRASLTVEAAVILPLFMMGLLALVSVPLMLLAGMRIQASVHDKAAGLTFVDHDGPVASVSDIGDEIAATLAKEDIRFIRSGRDGIDMTGSDIDDPEYIMLCAGCDLKPLTDVFGQIGIGFSAKCLSHVWCGYGHGFFPEGEYVYITDDGDVYHCDRNCSHIRLTIKEVAPGDIASLRNDSGSRYRPCEICHAHLSDGRLYVTSEGDRYHNSITCSALKRTVRAVRIEEAGDRRPCSRCGR